MAENKNTGIQIGQLNLRVPGSGTESGRRVANGIGENLAQKLPPGMHRHLGALSVRVQVPAGTSEAEMSDAVAEAVIRALRK